MLIKSISLKNIRSYSDLKLNFSSGTTLLSGDIGSGKTTILIALEFALFGILRGKTSPAELLRHGEKKGSVNLVCEINDSEIEITRVLKRSGKNILQSSGTLIINGHEESLVATELKAKILSLMGYPESLLSKSTNLFRYTVYTPQEQVKYILQESVEERKDIVRKIFNIDKYKLVFENANIYQNDLRSRIERLKGQVDDLKTLKEQKISQEKELKILENNFPRIEDEFLKFLSQRKIFEESLQDLRKQKQLHQEVLKQISVLETKISSVKRLQLVQEKNVAILKNELNKPLEEIKFDKTNLEIIQKNLLKVKEKFNLLNNRFGSFKAKKEELNDDSIEKLTICPTCKQEVGEEHKEHIKKIKDEKLKLLLQKENSLKKIESDLKIKEENYLKKQNDYLEQQKKFLLYSQEKIMRDEKEKKLFELEKSLSDYSTELSNLDIKLVAKKDVLKETPNINIDEKEDELNKLRIVERNAENKFTELKTKIKYSKDKLSELKIEIDRKEKIHQQAIKFSNIRIWINDLFMPLIKTVEKKVLYKVYIEFHSYFSKWFSMLIDDDDLLVKLDEEFTPLVFQHGFDTTIQNLSGGEKTAVALAYRLALNKVLNDYFGTLNTKGLLILDEPTDGFSSEQVDKLKDVLAQMNILQLIIVSHENRLESLPNQVIHVQKNSTSYLVN